MTEKQRELLLYIAARLTGDGISPSFEEMREHLGLASKSGVHRLLESLEEQKLIERQHGRNRRISLTDRGARIAGVPVEPASSAPYGRDPATLREAAKVAIDVIADHSRFPNIRIQAYSVASVIARDIYRLGGFEPPPMPDGGLPPLYINKGEPPRSRTHDMFARKYAAKPDGNPIVQPLTLAFQPEAATAKAEKMRPGGDHGELVRVRVTIAELTDEVTEEGKG